MCGMFGWILKSSDRQDRQLLVTLTDVLTHRGPDGGGYETLEIGAGAYQLGLGHRRLSILDLTDAGAQPMWSADRSICVVFNGEIYNFIELREELIARGHAFHTRCDTEVLIEAYRAWGKQAIEKFRGMFAFALYDAREQSLLFARDHFGKKPLFLYEKDGNLLFSSEIEPIVKFPGFDRRFDWDALSEYLLDRYVCGPRTFFRSIRKLEPGCLAEWRGGELTIERYYTPPLASTAPDIDNFDEAVALFSQTFEEAVRIRMRSDASFGAFLSGGLDSSAVVSVMSAMSDRPIKTFCVGFEPKQYSEVAAAEQVAAFFKTEHRSVLVTADDFFSHWDEAVLRRGAPVSEASDIPILLLSRLASESVKMVLTGEGADEFFGGYPKYIAERFVGAYQAIMPPSVHKFLDERIVDRLPFDMQRWKTLSRALAHRDPAERVRIWFGDMSPSMRDRLLNNPARQPAPKSFAVSIEGVSNLRRAQFFDQTAYLPDSTLERGDRMMMAGAIEGRMPFMDVELAALAARMPDSFLARPGWSKAVARTALRGKVPDFVLKRRKVGFRVPIHLWFRAERAEILRELLLSPQSETARFLDRDVVGKLVADHVSGVANSEKIIWSLMNLEKFIRIYKPDLSS